MFDPGGRSYKHLQVCKIANLLVSFTTSAWDLFEEDNFQSGLTVEAEV